MSFNPLRHGWVVALLAWGGMAVAQPEPKIIPDWPEETMRAPRPYVPLVNQPNPDVPLPQDALLMPTLENIAAYREEMQVALVAADLGENNNNPYWQMSQTALTVFLNKLATLDQRPVPEDTIWPQLPKPDPRYNGVLVVLQTKDGRRFVPFRVFMGQIAVGLGQANVLARDPGRALEYWLFGTARIRRDQLVGANVLPVYTFAQCKTLGQRVIETTPRQCLLANNNLLLETNEPPTVASAKMTSFAECLQGGRGLIYTFPRRCVAAGGRVFTEPPQIYDSTKPLPNDAPVRKPKTKRLAPTVVSRTIVTPTALQPLSVVNPVSGSAATPPPPMARMGDGLLQTTPAAPTWRQLGGPR